jgi:hypothetical protein
VSEATNRAVARHRARPHARAASSARRVAPALAVAGLLAAPAAGQAAVTSSSFPVVADAHTLQSDPSTNFGTATSLKVDASPLTTGYLRFKPQGLGGKVTKATLRLWATTASKAGFSVRPVASTSWSEKTIAYHNRPAVSSTVLARSGAYSGSRWLSLDVTRAVTTNGSFGFALVAAAAPQLMIGAREAGPARTPTLVVETTTDSTPAPAPIPTPAPMPTPTPGDGVAPSAPANLQATGGNAQVSLTWSAATDDVGVAGYRVYRNGVQVGAPTTTTYTDNGLTNGTTYVYTVRAVDGAGNVSASSASVPVTPLAPAIPPPLGHVRTFDAASPWNTAIPSDVAVLAKSATYVGAIVDNNTPLTSDPDQYSVPVYYFNAQTPRRTVQFAGSFSAYDAGDNSRLTPGYGASVANIPIPDGAVQSDGSDGQIVFWDPITGVEWSFWQFARTASGGYTATNGARYNTGAGNYGRFADGKSGRGAGTPYSAGLVRGWEIVQGHIDHALAFAYRSPASGIVYPASKSDGGGVTGVDAPEGTRFQLDPSLTDADFQAWGLAPEAKIIARAMQRYGMYVIDNSGSSKIYLEDRLTANWPASITRNLTAKIPLSKFRAVAAPTPPT